MSIRGRLASLEQAMAETRPDDPQRAERYRQAWAELTAGWGETDWKWYEGAMAGLKADPLAIVSDARLNVLADRLERAVARIESTDDT